MKDKGKEKERIWDFTTIDCFQTCRKKYYWRMVRNLKSKGVKQPLHFGEVVHDALDLYYTEGLRKALNLIEEKLVDKEGDDIRTKDSAKRLMETYAFVYKHEPFKPLFKPETGFVFLLGDILWGGRMDLPVTWNDELWIVEHKTTSRINSNYFNQFKLDKQVTGYILGAEAFAGRKCAGCVINAMEPWKILKRPTAKSKKPEEHFLRSPVTRSQSLKDRFTLNVNRIVRDILWCESNNEFYEAEKKDICFYYNSDCEYLDLCKYGEDPRIIGTQYEVEEWKPYKLEEKKEVKNELL